MHAMSLPLRRRITPRCARPSHASRSSHTDPAKANSIRPTDIRRDINFFSTICRCTVARLFFIFFFLDKKETKNQGVKKFAKKPPSKLKSVNSLRSDTTLFLTLVRRFFLTQFLESHRAVFRLLVCLDAFCFPSLLRADLFCCIS